MGGPKQAITYIFQPLIEIEVADLVPFRVATRSRFEELFPPLYWAGTTRATG